MGLCVGGRMGLFTSQERRTPAEWKERLSLENTPVTLDEYVAGTLIRMAGAMFESTLAHQHIEGMLGAIDDAFDRHDSEYAGSATIRTALLEQRRGEQQALTNGTDRAASSE